MEAWTLWTDGKPWQIAWGEFRWEGARRKDTVGGQETVGNSMGRAPLRGGKMEAWKSWTDGKPSEIAC